MQSTILTDLNKIWNDMQKPEAYAQSKLEDFFEVYQAFVCMYVCMMYVCMYVCMRECVYCEIYETHEISNKRLR